MSFNFFPIFSSGSYLVYRSGAILAFLIGSHLSIIPVKFKSNWPKDFEGIRI